MRVIELILSSEKLPLFSFLKSSPTLVLKNGDYYKFIYFEPVGEALTSFNYKGLYCTVKDERGNTTGWKTVRNKDVALASYELLNTLRNLEISKLLKKRQGVALELKDWILELICNGIYTRYETALLVRLLFVNGYSFTQLVDLFSAIVKRKELSSYFIEVSTQFYKEVAFE